jgi:hypothetical protein
MNGTAHNQTQEKPATSKKAPLVLAPRPTVDAVQLAKFAEQSNPESAAPPVATLSESPAPVAEGKTEDLTKKSIIFQISNKDRALLDAVFTKSTYKSRQALFEDKFISSLKQMATELGIEIQ